MSATLSQVRNIPVTVITTPALITNKMKNEKKKKKHILHETWHLLYLEGLGSMSLSNVDMVRYKTCFEVVL